VLGSPTLDVRRGLIHDRLMATLPGSVVEGVLREDESAHVKDPHQDQDEEGEDERELHG
jgi:hypothetical protein